MGNLLEIVNPVDMTGADLKTAIQLDWDDLEDCLIAVSAQKAGADFLLTRDTGGFSRSMTPVKSPAEWLAHMQETENDTFDTIDFA